jgi:tRNA (guanosine-2'-O-)-methyltransferase
MESLSPHSDRIEVDGSVYSADAVSDALATFLSPDRIQRIDSVIEQRTYTVTPVVEGMYDRGNVSAVLRTAEAFGLQSAHIIERGETSPLANRVTQGADKWLDIYRWESTFECLAYLADRGYRVVVTQANSAQPLTELDYTVPTAICFGNESEGISEELSEAADECVSIPMLGFTQSYNISVAAALSMQQIAQDRTRRLGHHGDLSAEEQRNLRAVYYTRAVKHAGKLLQECITSHADE